MFAPLTTAHHNNQRRPPTQHNSYLAAIALGPLVQSFAENHMMFALNVVGTKMRNALMAAIYRKCLRLSNSAMQSESTGKVRVAAAAAVLLGCPADVCRAAGRGLPTAARRACCLRRDAARQHNAHKTRHHHHTTHIHRHQLQQQQRQSTPCQIVTLMSNDAQKVQEVVLGVHVLWGAPVLIVTILVLLYQQVGWATFVGLAVMLVYTPLSAKVSGKLVGLRRSLMKWTDTRVGLMNEIINGMQVRSVVEREGAGCVAGGGAGGEVRGGAWMWMCAASCVARCVMTCPPCTHHHHQPINITTTSPSTP